MFRHLSAKLASWETRKERKPLQAAPYNIPIRPNCSHVMMPLIGLHDLVADHATGHDHGHDHPQPLVATKGRPLELV